MNTSDWSWFAKPENASRSYRLRLATPAEIDDLRQHGVFDRCCSLQEGCFVHALSRKREDGCIQTLMIVWRAGQELSEAECRSEWFKADRILAGKVERLAQWIPTSN